MPGYLQEVGSKIAGNKINVFTPGSKNFKSSAIAEKCTKQTYSLLTARKKISLDKNSLEIQAKRCYFIFNP